MLFWLKELGTSLLLHSSYTSWIWGEHVLLDAEHLRVFFGCCLFLLHFLMEVPLQSTHIVVGIVSRARRTSSDRPWWYHYLSLGETSFPNTRDCSFFTSQEGLTNFRCLSVIFAPFANLFRFKYQACNPPVFVVRCVSWEVASIKYPYCKFYQHLTAHLCVGIGIPL